MFKIDADFSTIDSGVWTSWSGSQFKIANLNSIKFQRALAKLQQPYRKKIEQGSMDPAVTKDILCRAMAQAILLDWKDVLNKDDQKVEYTEDAAYLGLKGNPEFRDFVAEFAGNVANYRKEEVEELGKPS